jgi:hypothetical protein
VRAADADGDADADAAARPAAGQWTLPRRGTGLRSAAGDTAWTTLESAAGDGLIDLGDASFPSGARRPVCESESGGRGGRVHAGVGRGGYGNVGAMGRREFVSVVNN